MGRYANWRGILTHIRYHRMVLIFVWLFLAIVWLGAGFFLLASPQLVSPCVHALDCRP